MFENGTLRFDLNKYEVDKNKSPDVVTMEVVRDIANSIDGMIVMTVDAPSNHEDKKVPMLDVKVWLNDEDNNKIYYQYYEKPTKSKYVISKTSAMPMPQN